MAPVEKLPVSRSHACPECSKAFKTSGSLRRHVRIHKPNGPYKCPYVECSRAIQGFNQSNQLKTHVCTAHEPWKKPYKCGVGSCEATFNDPSLRRRHAIRVHSAVPGSRIAPAALDPEYRFYNPIRTASAATTSSFAGPHRDGGDHQDLPSIAVKEEEELEVELELEVDELDPDIYDPSSPSDSTTTSPRSSGSTVVCDTTAPPSPADSEHDPCQLAYPVTPNTVPEATAHFPFVGTRTVSQAGPASAPSHTTVYDLQGLGSPIHLVGPQRRHDHDPMAPFRAPALSGAHQRASAMQAMQGTTSQPMAVSRILPLPQQSPLQVHPGFPAGTVVNVQCYNYQVVLPPGCVVPSSSISINHLTNLIPVLSSRLVHISPSTPGASQS